jgi:methionine-rich copper-binding protein CopC
MERFALPDRQRLRVVCDASRLASVHSVAMDRTLRILAALSLLLWVTAGPASAHATLLSSTPAAGAVVTELPPSIVLSFDDDLTDASSFDLVNAAGSTVAHGAVSADDPTMLTVATPSLADGAYEVRWTAGTSDGHIERGTVSFTVAIGATASPSAAPSDTPGGGAGDAVLPVVAAAVLIAAGLLWLLRRRGAS